MTRKKFVKQIMALGVQRNDAAGFVSTYRACVAAGKEHLLPTILQPAPIVPAIPIIHQHYKVEKFTIVTRCTDKYDFRRYPRSDEDIYRELTQNIGMALRDAGAISFFKREDYTLQCVEYRATINVAMEATT